MEPIEKVMFGLLGILSLALVIVIGMGLSDAITDYKKTGYFHIKKIDIKKCRELGVKNYE